MQSKVLIVAALLSAAVSCLSAPVVLPAPGAYSAAEYSFQYRVLEAPLRLDFGHRESRSGPDTAGFYHVLLPDGRVQRVTYSVTGDLGFVADVDYEGETILESSRYHPRATRARSYRLEKDSPPIAKTRSYRPRTKTIELPVATETEASRDQTPATRARSFQTETETIETETETPLPATEDTPTLETVGFQAGAEQTEEVTDTPNTTVFTTPPTIYRQDTEKLL